MDMEDGKGEYGGLSRQDAQREKKMNMGGEN